MIIGKGSETVILTKDQIYGLCAEAFEARNLDGKKVLVILPDLSRTAPIDVMFPIVYKLLADRVKTLDFLIALGTHPLLSDDDINERIGITMDERTSCYPKARFFNHVYNDLNQLAKIGTITEEEVAELSGGLMRRTIDITINNMALDHDLLMIIGPTYPHEIVGLSGGNKYFFPGISGGEIINSYHWLGALITNPVIIGSKNTPTRAIVERAASFIPTERMCLSMVVKGNDLAGLYIGSPEEAFSAAADLARKVNIVYKDRPFQRVLSCATKMYDDLWVAGKCMFKLEPVVADGGELIIYAPHVSEISWTHGADLKKVGYHVRDYYVKQMDKFKDIPGAVLTHASLVKGIGTYENGIEKPRINVLLATQIPREICKKINLGYCDPASIDVADWKDREDEGILYVQKAGETLYRLKNDPFKV